MTDEDKLARLRLALPFGTQQCPLLNLVGVLLDMQRQEADPICIETIQRVQDRLERARDILEEEESNEQQADRRDDENPHEGESAD